MTWPTVQLGKICRPRQHKTIPASEMHDTGYVVYGANGPIGHYSDFTHDRTTIAVTCRGATCGTINIVPPRSYITGNAMALDDLDESRVDLKFLAYALKNIGFASVINGAAQPQITRAPLLTYEVPLPPLEEQKRIAAILDQADALRRLRVRALERLNALVQAIFHEMFGGESDHTVMLAEAGQISTGSTPPTSRPDLFVGSIPFMTPGDLDGDAEPKRWLSHEGASLSRTVEAGATLVCCIASVGKMRNTYRRCAFNQQINAVQWNEHFDPTFGLFALREQRKVIEEWANRATTTVPILKKSEFMKLPIRHVEIAMQRNFANKVSVTMDNRSVLSIALDRAETLFTSLQHRAFRGEL